MSQEFKTIGEELRAQREAKGLNLEDMVGILKIRARYLHALEEGEATDLPFAYCRGYLYHYSTALGLDGDAVVERFKDEEENFAKAKTLLLPEPQKESMKPSPVILALSVIVAIVVYLYWYQGEFLQTKIADITSMLVSEKNQIFSGTSSDENDQPIPGSLRLLKKDLASGSRIVLLAKRTTWIKLQTENHKFLLEKELHPGDSYLIPDRDDLVVTAGNPDVVEVFVNGKKNRFLGTMSKILPIPLSEIMPASGGDKNAGATPTAQKSQDSKVEIPSSSE